MTNRRITVMVTGIPVVFTAMSLFYSFYGRIFLDAGFYMNAAREVYRGRVLYRDFFYVQGPVYPYVYGLPLYFTGHEVIIARWISMAFSLAALFLAGWTAKRLGGVNGMLIALLSLGTVPSHAYYFTSVKLYALSGFLLVAAFAVLATRISMTWRHTAGLILALMAAATRLTLLPAVIVIAVYVIFDSYSLRKTFPGIATGCALIVGLCLSVPFLLIDSEAVLYYLIGIHTSAAEGPYVFGLPARLKVLGAVAVTYPLVAIAGVYVILKSVSRKCRARLQSLEIAMIIAILSVTIAHVSANWFSVGYQSVLMPVTAALVGGISGRLVSVKRVPRSALALILVVMVGSAVINWRKHIWIKDPQPITQYMDDIGRMIEQYAPADGTIAACSAIFALHTGRQNAGAFGGAPFTYTPEWPDDKCRRFGGVNNRIFVEMLQHQSIDILLFEPDSFAVGFPGFFPVSESRQAEIFEAVDTWYERTGTFRSLGNGFPTLTMYVPRRDGVLNEPD